MGSVVKVFWGEGRDFGSLTLTPLLTSAEYKPPGV
jgi:hypothetical protein